MVLIKQKPRQQEELSSRLSSQSVGWELTSQQSREVCCENWKWVVKAHHSLETRRPCRRESGYVSLCSETRQQPDSQEARVDQEESGHLCSARNRESGGQWALRAWGSKQAKAKIQEVWEGKIMVPIHQNTEKSPILKAEIVRANISFNYSPSGHMVLRTAEVSRAGSTV